MSDLHHSAVRMYAMNFCKLLEMHSGKAFADFYFRGSGWSNLQLFYLAHILFSCTCQYECDDVLDGFWGPGDGCRSATGGETVPGQIFASITAATILELRRFKVCQ